MEYRVARCPSFAISSRVYHRQLAPSNSCHRFRQSERLCFLRRLRLFILYFYGWREDVRCQEHPWKLFGTVEDCRPPKCYRRCVGFYGQRSFPFYKHGNILHCHFRRQPGLGHSTRSSKDSKQFLCSEHVPSLTPVFRAAAIRLSMLLRILVAMVYLDLMMQE
jgi:hypothetical protein